ncbi:MAG: hypothetical protein J3T61_12495, partial [Candidatus Brocadiales bacterium]|nr:hypothetical protein [Candidatus Bathyanammoxibius sp.]
MAAQFNAIQGEAPYTRAYSAPRQGRGVDKHGSIELARVTELEENSRPRGLPVPSLLIEICRKG